MYSKRWGIETGYRNLDHDFKAKTTTRNYHIRLFYFLFSTCYFYINQYYPLFNFLAMASPLKIRLQRLQNQITEIIFLCCISYFLFSGVHAQQTQDIRVAIIQDAPSVRIKIDGAYEIYDTKSGRLISEGKKLNTTVTTSAGSILLGVVESKSGKLLLKPSKSSVVIVNGRMFRGDIEIAGNLTRNYC